MRARGTPFVVMLALVFAGQNETKFRLQPKQLSVTSTHELTIPTLSPYGTASCDGKGNLFSRVPLESGSLNESTVIRLSADESEPKAFRLPPDLRTKTAFDFFSVTPSGRVWFLDETMDGPLMALGFDSDAELDSQVKLEVPAHISADAFSVSNTGAILVIGHFSADSPADMQGKRFAAIFEKSGRLRSEVQLKGLPGIDLKAIPSGDGGTVAQGIDGNFYFLSPSEVVVVSESGDVVRKLPFERPDHDFSVHNISESSELISIEFHRVDETSTIQTEYVILDASTGDVYGTYTPPDGAGLASCFSRTKGYVFLRGKNRKEELVFAALR